MQNSHSVPHNTLDRFLITVCALHTVSKSFRHAEVCLQVSSKVKQAQKLWIICVAEKVSRVPLKALRTESWQLNFPNPLHESWRDSERFYLSSPREYITPLSLERVHPNNLRSVIIYLFSCFQTLTYRCFSINYNVVERFIYFSNSTQIVKLVY